jgi:DNA gyrase subunit A
MDKITTEMLEDIKKGTVDFKPNYDGSLEEPEVLPSKLPNLLLNGSTGIAVGMATNMAPHNLGEVVDATVKLIDDPDTELSELRKIVKGPDFPTGGIIMGTSGIKSAYETGRSPIHLRAVTEIEEMKNDKFRIVVYELPYQVNKARLVESIANLVRDKKIEGISDLRDESGREGMRVVIELKKGINPKVLLNQLYKQTQLETTFGIINLALVDGVPRVLNLRELIQIYLKHRIDVITRRTAFDLRKAEERAHILQGLKVALDNIDEVIKLIRGSSTTEEAREGLISNFNLDETQAKAILDMRLQRLTGLEREKIDEEYNGLIDMIADLKDILANDERKYAIIKDEVLELKDKYGDERRTLIQGSREELADEDLIPEEEVVVTSTQSGYIKNIPLQTYNMQHRGGRGVRGMETKEDDTVGSIFVASTHDYILFFTNHGKVYWQKVYDIPRGSRQSRGKAIVNLLELAEGESVNAMIPVHDFEKDRYLFMGTRDGTVKRCSLSDFSNPRKAGIIAISLKEGDELVNVLQTDGNQDIMLASRHGKALRISEEDVRVMGRTARGVRGMKLAGSDVIVSLDVVDSDATLLTVTENGFGKRTPFDEYRTLHRGGQGVITIATDMRNGPVVNVKTVEDDDEIILTSSAGIVIRIPVTDIRVQGRNTKGVKIMNIRDKDKLVSLARIKKEE